MDLRCLQSKETAGTFGRAILALLRWVISSLKRSSLYPKSLLSLPNIPMDFIYSGSIIPYDISVYIWYTDEQLRSPHWGKISLQLHSNYTKNLLSRSSCYSITFDLVNKKFSLSFSQKHLMRSFFLGIELPPWPYLNESLIQGTFFNKNIHKSHDLI